MLERLIFTGDINFSDSFFDLGFGVGSSIRNGANPFRNIERHPSDYWIGNCECVISNNSRFSNSASKQFRIDPDELESVPHMNCYAISNNHIMQHGIGAYQSMQHYFISNDISFVGSTDKPYHVIEISGKKIAIIAFSQRLEQFTSSCSPYCYVPEYRDILSIIEQVKSEVDFVTVYVHWGNEFINRPYFDQTQFAHLLVDWGVNLIVGMHPHVLQGYEVYKGAHIFYSIGNFVFNMPTESTHYGAIVYLSIGEDGMPIVNFDYIHIGDDFFPRIIPQEEVPDYYLFDALNRLVSKRSNNEEYYIEVRDRYQKYRKKNITAILQSIPRFKPSDLYYIITDFLKRRF